jgi:hypothetical protein
MHVNDLLEARREMIDLLRQQMEVLDSLAELSDSQLRECYNRQCRVQELRETLQTASDAELESNCASIPDCRESNVISIDSVSAAA